ncbi:hypothetical protein [Xanthomonas vesicatoria]
MAKHTMRTAGEAVTRPAGDEDSDLAAGTTELQGGGKTCKSCRR